MVCPCCDPCRPCQGPLPDSISVTIQVSSLNAAYTRKTLSQIRGLIEGSYSCSRISGDQFYPFVAYSLHPPDLDFVSCDTNVSALFRCSNGELVGTVNFYGEECENPSWSIDNGPEGPPVKPTLCASGATSYFASVIDGRLVAAAATVTIQI
jgi:hypothetical protein